MEHAARSSVSVRDGNTSMKTQHASVVMLLEPPSIIIMLQCPLLAHPSTLDDLLKFNENTKKCEDKWKNAV